jgi:Ca-activated chloride channel family protein
VPLVVTGRYAGRPGGRLTVTGRTRDDREFRTTVPVQERAEPAVTAQWARARLRDLEDAYAAGDRSLEGRIVTTSLRYGVLCRFTAFVAVDSRVVNEGGETRRVTQPVELPSGWDSPDAVVPMYLAAASMPAPPMPPAPGAPPRFAPARADSPGPASHAPRPAAPGHDGSGPVPAAGGGAGVRRARAPMGFVTASPAMRSAKTAAPTGPSLSPADLQALAATEAQRLRDAADRPAYERRELLDDLASRLNVLIGSADDPGLAPLRDLVAFLGGDADLDAKWSAALDVLTGYAETTTAETTTAETATEAGKPGPRPFWKR